MERVGPWAHCARCDAPVKRITTWVDPENAQLVITVDCHGERETVRVSQEFMLAGDVRLSDWEAFQYERPSLPTRTIASNPALLTAGIDSVHEPTRVSRGLPCEDGQTTTPNRPLRSRRKRPSEQV